MGFKENLKDELRFQGMLVKELADRSGVPKGTIDHYLAEKCTAPIAENAVKIAQALGVTVEYLVTGKNSLVTEKEFQKNSEFDIKMYKKYHETIKKLELMPPETKRLFCQLVETWGKTNLSE